MDRHENNLRNNILHKNKKILAQALKKTLKQDLMLQITNYKDHYQKGKRKGIELLKENLGEKTMTDFVALTQVNIIAV